MKVIPTYLKVLISIYGALVIVAALSTWSIGYDFPVAAFSALGILLNIAVFTNRQSWVLPLLIIGLSDEAAALFLPIDEGTSFAARILGLAMVTALFITWIRFERSAPQTPEVNTNQANQ